MISHWLLAPPLHSAGHISRQNFSLVANYPKIATWREEKVATPPLGGYVVPPISPLHTLKLTIQVLAHWPNSLKKKQPMIWLSGKVTKLPEVLAFPCCFFAQLPQISLDV